MCRRSLPGICRKHGLHHFNNFLSTYVSCTQPEVWCIFVCHAVCFCICFRDYCIAARSLVCPNDGFWRVLCALEGPLGILNK
jgi:hypothetical protein